MGIIHKRTKEDQLIGIMGGTFDPIHYGHTEMALHCLNYFGLDKVIFIPSGIPPHKAQAGVIDKEHRYEMVRLAIKDIESFEISRIETDREGFTYTIDTLNQLKDISQDANFYYIIGADTLNELYSWKRIEDIAKLTKFLVVGRNKIPSDVLHSAAARVREDFGGQLIDACYVGLNISSTEIRKKIQEGRSISGLVDPLVEEYIIKNELYRD